ncbi:SGNH/GDSL hydrolase family protein [Jiangella rhizosphaerae]|uniref:SGNH/GDSL hydrolase family protein n=1 Tax=Jiangella rhizosphaerae TaxID=2293569 RepID=UPI0011C40D05|nr:SGNH/GDSL hydrolase family protein [Jiangella rhizosphaerae]
MTRTSTTHHQRSPRSIARTAVTLGVAAVVLVGAAIGAAADASATETAEAADDVPSAVVTLGDSYSSGLGAGGYLDDCDRTPQAWNNLVFGNAVTDRTLLACSGAAIPDVAQQVQQLAAIPGAGDRLITVTVGGNDAGFADELVNCLVSFVSCTRREAELSALISGLHQPLVQLYDAVQAAAPGDEVIVGGYPMLVPDPAVRSDCPALTGLLSTSERQMIRRLGMLLNDVIDGAAAEAGVESASDEVAAVFDGHEACANAPGDWLYGLKISWTDSTEPTAPATASASPYRPQWDIVSSFVRDSFHPTVNGQAGYAVAFEEAWAAR